MSDPGLVLKLPRYNKRFDVYNGLRSNLQEWWIWHNAPELRPWLCRPVRLEMNGLGLIMERGKPISRKDIPTDAPKIIAKNDNTHPNWVVVNGAVMRCDYHAIYKSLKRMIDEGRNGIV